MRRLTRFTQRRRRLWRWFQVCDATHMPHTNDSCAHPLQRRPRGRPTTVASSFVASAQREHAFLFRAETQLPLIVVLDSNGNRRQSARGSPLTPSPPPSPPAAATRLPYSTQSPPLGKPRSAPTSIIRGLSSRWQCTPSPSSTRKGLQVKLGETKIAGVEYSLQKLDQLRARLRLILSQHLVASKYYMTRYYALAFPSIAMSSFLTVISLIVPRLPGCDDPMEGAQPPKGLASNRMHLLPFAYKICVHRTCVCVHHKCR